MPFDAFLKIDGIPGESTDSKHKDEIEILSFSWGETQVIDRLSGGGAGAGKVSMQDFHFVMRTSKASPRLFLAGASGQHIPEATLTLRKAGGAQVEYLKWTLSDVLVSGLHHAGDAEGGDVVPTEQLSLNFAKIEFSYTPQKADGSSDTPVVAGWDLEKNTKV